jgi:nucleotidyltransferase substrate binding protein (TIGR01987 family)
MAKIDFSKLEEALATLVLGLNRSPLNELERDGVIQRFEYTFELAWKTAKRVLATMGLEANSPKDVLRTMGQQRWIDVERWFLFLEGRNSVTHIYDKKVAERVFQTARDFAPECQKLVSVFRKLDV